MYQGYILARGYEIIDILGSGGMATVYRGRDRGLNREVAIKVIGTHLAHDADYMQRFTREAETIARLQHPNIIQVYDSGQDQFGSYVVMPLLGGGTLQERMRQTETLISIRETGNLVRQIGTALHYAHRKSIIHRDIKFSNIMFDTMGTPYVMDFGIAKLLDATQLTGTSSPIGTPQFMPPEQWRGSNVTEAVDQYALAVVLYKLVTGHPPFDGNSSEALMYQHLEATAPRAESYRPEIPEQMGDVFERALSKNPADRFPSMIDFAGAFYKASRKSSARNTGFFTFSLSQNPTRPIPSTGTQSQHPPASSTPLSYPPVSSHPTPPKFETDLQTLPQTQLGGVQIAVLLLILMAMIVGSLILLNTLARNSPSRQTQLTMEFTESALEHQANQNVEATRAVIVMLTENAVESTVQQSTVISELSVNSDPIAQGEDLELSIDAFNADSIDVLVNQLAIFTDLPGNTESVIIGTSELSGNVEITVFARNRAQSVQSSISSYVYVPIAMNTFDVTPNPLIRNTVNTLTISWDIAGAAFVRISGLSDFTNNLIQSATEYGAVHTLGIGGIPDAPLELMLYAEDKAGTSIEVTLTVALVDPQCTTIREVPVYGGPDSRYQQVATIPDEAIVVVLAQDADADWLRLQLPGDIQGWGISDSFDCAENFDLSSLRTEFNIPDLPTSAPPQVTVQQSTTTAESINENAPMTRIFRYGGTLDTIRTLLANNFEVWILLGYDPPELNNGWAEEMLVITGYDNSTRVFQTSNSGDYNYDYIEEYWQHTNYTYFVVYRPNRIDELMTLLGVDAAYYDNFIHAINIAIEEAEEDDNDPFAWFNIGINYYEIAMRTSNVDASDEYLDRAQIAFDQAMSIGVPVCLLQVQPSAYHTYYLLHLYTQTIRIINDVIDNCQNPNTYGRERLYYFAGLTYQQMGDMQNALDNLNLAKQMIENNHVFVEFHDDLLERIAELQERLGVSD